MGIRVVVYIQILWSADNIVTFVCLLYWEHGRRAGSNLRLYLVVVTGESSSDEGFLRSTRLLSSTQTSIYKTRSVELILIIHDLKL